MKNRLLVASAIFCLMWCVTNVQAQGIVPDAPEGGFSGLPLDQLPPGARALGLGGAFTAVADDATAALANPAGLTNLSAPEVSLFLRNTDSDVNFLDPEAFNAAYLGEAEQKLKNFNDSTTTVSFASFVLPMEGFVFSGFYSNQLDFKAEQSKPDTYFNEITPAHNPFDPPISAPLSWLDTYTNQNSVEASVENVGLSAAFRFTDRFSAGVTIRNSKLDLKSLDSFELNDAADWEWFFADIHYDIYEGRPATIDEAKEFLPVFVDSYKYSTLINGSSEELVVDLGAFYRADKWSFGVTYHSGSKFNFSSVGTLESNFSCIPVAAGPGNDLTFFEECQFWLEAFDSVPVDPNDPNSPSVVDIWYPQTLEDKTDVTIRIPDVISFGVAWRPADTWLFSLDVNYIEYSVLNSPRNVPQGGSLIRSGGIDINDLDQRPEYYDSDFRTNPNPITEPISDGTTFHFGAEKSFFFDSGFLRTLALRGGAFTIVDHDGIVATDKDEVVWTVGLGSTWGKNELGAKVFQMDLGASIADDATNIVLSGIFRF